MTLRMPIDEERALAEALENDAVYVDSTTVKRVEFLIASVKAEKAIDFDMGATWYRDLDEIYVLLNLAKEKLESFVYRKELKKGNR